MTPFGYAKGILLLRYRKEENARTHTVLDPMCAVSSAAFSSIKNIYIPFPPTSASESMSLTGYPLRWQGETSRVIGYPTSSQNVRRMTEKLSKCKLRALPRLEHKEISTFAWLSSYWQETGTGNYAGMAKRPEEVASRMR